MEKLKYIHSYIINHLLEFFLNNTNLTFLAFSYKIYIKGVQNQQKIKLPPLGIELTTLAIYG